MRRQRINLLDKYKSIKRPLILDGAMGSLLQQRGINTSNPLWSSIANFTHKNLVKQIHLEYIKSGAEIITTNTFRTNPLAFEKSDLQISYHDFIKNSISNAIEAVENKEIIIAGSNAPAEDCYQKSRTITIDKLEYNHKKHIELLWENGVDVIWNETQSHWDEIKIICEFCSANNLPFVVNLFFDSELKLLSGEPLIEAIKFIESYTPVAIGLNCIQYSLIKAFFNENSFNYNWGFYLNCGPDNIDLTVQQQITCAVNEKEYLEIIKEYLHLSPIYVGACCGSNPNHIKEIKNYLDELYKH
ncbi:homocysteine S-methyltransferase family protein [Melioribacteraceae bacterium 4301-Me]|uniref:homocysteine S-methyltransferase family protein n=1 Tax=Pyranulibacter aquaticus TaxID=3163344 RepID=UPI00359A294B